MLMMHAHCMRQAGHGRRSAVLVAISVLALLLRPAAAGGCPFAHLAGGAGGHTPSWHHSGHASRHEWSGGAGAAGQGPRRAAEATVWAGELPEAHNASDALVRMNQLVFPAYEQAGEQLQPEQVLIVEGDYLVLRHRDGERAIMPYNKPVYHDLKMVAHTLLALFVMLYPHASTYGDAQPLDTETRNRVVAYARAMSDALPTLSRERFPAPGQLARQIRIMGAAEKAAASAVLDGTCSMEALQAYVDDVMDDVMVNVMEAGRVQVSGLLRVTREVQQSMSPEAWAAVKVAVPSSHMARTQSLVAQFYARYFGVDIELNERFITTERVSSEQAMLSLVNAHQVDYGLGRVAFRQLFRMHDDLLCHAASTALDELLPHTRGSTVSVHRTAATARDIRRTGCRSPSQYDEPAPSDKFPIAPALAAGALVLGAVAAAFAMGRASAPTSTLPRSVLHAKPSKAGFTALDDAMPAPERGSHGHSPVAAAPDSGSGVGSRAGGTGIPPPRPWSPELGASPTAAATADGGDTAGDAHATAAGADAGGAEAGTGSGEVAATAGRHGVRLGPETGPNPSEVDARRQGGGSRISGRDGVRAAERAYYAGTAPAAVSEA